MIALFLLSLLLPFTKNVSQAQEIVQTAISSQSIGFINPLIGTTGPYTGASGGMIPSISYPFGTVRWVVQNQKNFVSAAPFNYSTSDKVHGFIGTRQPAVWMGENAPVGIVPGISTGGEAVKTDWDARAMDKVADSEEFGIGHYVVRLDGGNGTTIQVNMSATSKAAHFAFNFTSQDVKANLEPYIWIPVARESVRYHTDHIYVPYFPNGTVNISVLKAGIEICGSNDEFGDILLVPISVRPNAQNLRGWFCARFNFTTSGGYEYGVTQGKEIHEGALEGQGTELGAYVRFPSDVTWVEVRIGTSMISASQARYNLEDEIPEGRAIEDTRKMTDMKWTEKLGRFEVETTAEDVKTVFYTSVWRGMQYPYEVSESSGSSDSKKHYYSAFTNSVHEGDSYNGYSIW
ncbi:glycoside hydrolase family 92 protein, partial [Moniliophthora roreri MCA 2997]